MEIFVRAYRDSDGDGIGDLRGLTQQLDYLRDLGIRGIWLMPITESADRDHGYATTDFRALERDYGTMQDFDMLLREAHRRGIGVIVDYVVNHSAAAHPMFVASKSSADNPFRNWFVWQNEPPTGWEIWGKNPWYAAETGTFFGTFGAHMPDFNLRNPDVVRYHEDSLRFWLNRGLDGFRLDAVPHLIENSATDWNDQPESRALTASLTALIKSYPRAHVVCEATAKPIVYGAQDVCGSAFAFEHERNIIRAAKGDRDAMRKVADYFVTAPLTMATMLSNHDIFAGKRAWDQFEGNEAPYKLAAATYLLQPGTPFIYYGEEIGMSGVSTLAGDMPLRAPMSWTNDATRAGFTTGSPFRPIAPNVATHNVAAAKKNSQSIYHFYKTMIGLRNTHPSIARGSYEHPFVEANVLGFQRVFSGQHNGKAMREQTLVLINYGAEPAKVLVDNLPANARATQVYPRIAARAVRATRVSGTTLVSAMGTHAIAVPPQSVSVWVLVK